MTQTDDVAILFTIAAVVYLAEMFTSIVYPEDIEWAEQVCSNNGGVHFIDKDWIEVNAKCSNGAVFDILYTQLGE